MTKYPLDFPLVRRIVDDALGTPGATIQNCDIVSRLQILYVGGDAKTPNLSQNTKVQNIASIVDSGRSREESSEI